MKVIYTAPNRAHHYRYASALNKQNILFAFVSGFSRFSPRAKITELKGKIFRADYLQTIYLASLKFSFPQQISSQLAYLAKIEQDYACRKFTTTADIFLFYNGSGLNTCNYAKSKGIITIVEVVNSHVDYQEQLLKEEHEKLNLLWQPFHKAEKKRRVQEYQLADYILLPSEFVKKSFLDKGFPEEKLLKLPYGFVNNPQEIVLKEDDFFTILYVGSVSVRKGLRYLIEAFNKVSIPNKKLLIVGSKSKITGIEDLNITSNIEFTGVLKGNDLEMVYKEADVFCLPTIEDGFGLVLGEALSYGLPIITTTNSGGQDIIDDGIEGYIVPIRDSEAIYSKLELLSQDSQILNKMKLAAQRKSSTLDGWDESGKRLCSILNQVYLQRKN
jgi:starch synthase